MTKRKKRAGKAEMVARDRYEFIQHIRANATCPYFKDATLYEMQCQSIIKHANINLRFKTQENLKAYSERFCQNLAHCNKCPYNKLNTLYFNTIYARNSVRDARRELDKILQNYK